MVAPQIDRLLADIDTLATFTEPDTPGWDLALPVGGLFGRARLGAPAIRGGGVAGVGRCRRKSAWWRLGRRPLPAIFVGFDTDSVFSAAANMTGRWACWGRWKRPVLAEAGCSLHHPLVVMDYLAQEANDFGVSCVGSRAPSAGIQPAWFERQHLGLTLWKRWYSTAACPPPHSSGCCSRVTCTPRELHIEQGPVLESQGVAVAAVTGIVGIRRGMFELSGRADHAGTTPMTLRRDALAAAAEIIVGLETLARNTPGLVGTVGRLLVQPNQSNVVAETVTFVLEIRSLDVQQIAQGWDAVQALLEQACRTRGVGHSLLA